MERRGQAAMEFLMTYGWAILAAVIAIAVLAYFGVFSPSRYIPNTCQITAPLGCNPDLTNATSGTPGHLDIRIVNGGADTITPTNVSVSNCGEVTTGLSAIAVGSEATASITCGTLSPGQKLRGTVMVTYTKNSVPNLQSTGSLTTTVR